MLENEESAMLMSGPIKDFALAIYDGPHATPKDADNGAIYLGVKNITEDGRLDLSEIKWIAEEDYPRWIRRVEPQPDDLVFTYEASLHRYARIPEGFRGCLGRRVALVRPDLQKVDSRYLLYYFLSHEWRSVVERAIIIGATVDRIPIERFPDFPVRLPDLTTQRRIAAILSAYDDLIENNRRRMALLEEAMHRLYRQWFVHLRFPGHEQTPIRDGVPEGWRKRRVTEVISFNPSTPTPRGELLPFVPMTSLQTDSMLINEIEQRIAGGGAKFKNGDTLLARITPCLENGKTAFVQFLDDDQQVTTGSTEFIVMRSQSVSPYWVYCLARSYHFRQFAINSMVGSDGRQRVQSDAFEKYTILAPPKSLLQEFDAIAEPAFHQIKTLATQNRRLRQARDLLLPRLMNGSIPL